MNSYFDCTTCESGAVFFYLCKMYFFTPQIYEQNLNVVLFINNFYENNYSNLIPIYMV